LYMYYGNSTVASGQSPAAVWSNGYAAVYHMNEASGNMVDSNQNNLASTIFGAPTHQVNGKIGDSYQFNGTSQYGIINSTQFRSIQLWINTNTVSGFHYMLDARIGSANGHVSADEIGADWSKMSVNGSNVTPIWGSIPKDNWSSIYLENSANRTDNLNIMSKFTNDEYLAGSLDEIRISSVVRSADWIATEYANQNNPSTFFSINTEAIYDLHAPSNPNTISAYSTSEKIASITSNSFYNYHSPYFEWSGAADTGNAVVSGVAGYYLYFGTSCGDGGGDPVQSRGVLSDTGGGLHYSTLANISIPDMNNNEGEYCLRIKAVDNVGNIADTTWEAYAAYKYDVTAPTAPSYIAVNPTGYSSTNSFNFSWPIAGDTINAHASGVIGYQYMRGGSSGDSWSPTITSNSITNIASYQTGENIFLVRTVDTAGNLSEPVQTLYYYSNSSPTKPTSLLVNPVLSDQNSFSFSWSAPEHSRPIISYGYTINNENLTNENIIWTGSNTRSLSADHFATKQGINTLYLIAKDDTGAYSTSAESVATINFNCTSAAPPIPSSLSIVDTSNRISGQYSLSLLWKAGNEQNASSFDHYSIERSLDGINFTEIATSVATQKTDAANLDNNTRYYYQVKSYDNAGGISAPSSIVSKIPTGKYTSPPTIVAEPTVTAVSSSANISWAVNRPSIPSVRYGTNKDNLSAVWTSASATTETNHIVGPITGLEPGTTYYYQVQSLDAYRDYAADSAYSTTYQFTTLAAPSIANVIVSNITLNSADVTWETSSASNTKIYFGPTINYGFVLPENEESMTTRHTIKMQNLADSSRYHFQIAGNDINGNNIRSDDYIFDTLEMPKISAIDYQIDYTGPMPIVNFSWVTNVATTSSVQYSVAGIENTDIQEQSQSAMVAPQHNITINKMQFATKYRFIVFGTDQFGNKIASDPQILNTAANIRPPIISNITIESSNVGSGNLNTATVVVYWETDALANSQVAYDSGLSGSDYRKKTILDGKLTKNHIVVISGLNPGAPYHFQIITQDEVGNTARSDDQAVITGAVTQSVFTIISQTFNNIFGWLGKI